MAFPSRAVIASAMPRASPVISQESASCVRSGCGGLDPSRRATATTKQVEIGLPNTFRAKRSDLRGWSVMAFALQQIRVRCTERRVSLEDFMKTTMKTLFLIVTDRGHLDDGEFDAA
jgi:hypothetical protein